MKLVVSPRARDRIRKIDAWWRDHREAKDLFKEELAEAFDRIARAPRIRPPYAEIEGEPIWRLLMARTEQHVYYTVNDATNEIIVETVWGARRGKGPEL